MTRCEVLFRNICELIISKKLNYNLLYNEAIKVRISLKIVN